MKERIKFINIKNLLILSILYSINLIYLVINFNYIYISLIKFTYKFINWLN